MPRTTHTPASKRRRKKKLKLAKGYFGGRRKLIRTATETVNRALRFATRDRKQRKRMFRRLWNTRINAACRQCGTTYSKFIAALKRVNIQLNRKSLAETAVRDFEAIQKLIEMTVKTGKSTK